MKVRICVFSILLSGGIDAVGQFVGLDPDGYANGTVLNQIIPEVSLITAGQDNLPHPPQGFDVTVYETSFPWQPPTGDSVFAHAGVGFWNTDRRLRMDFNGLVASLSIDFQGGNNLVAEQGLLEVYTPGGALAGTYRTQPLFGGQVETMSISRPVADIAWAVAYTIPGESVFGRLDHLVFTSPVQVPEPQTTVLLALGAVGAVGFTKRRLRSNPIKRPPMDQVS